MCWCYLPECPKYVGGIFQSAISVVGIIFQSALSVVGIIFQSALSVLVLSSILP